MSEKIDENDKSMEKNESTMTAEQQEAVEYRNGNLLVSAAAGAGKTFVLVKRIMERIINEGLSLEELLVVTFTKDAAKEMKERIEKEISQKLEEKVKIDINSEISKRLMRQSTILQGANISTIDSFCKKVVMENFKEAGIDTSVRTVDDAEGVIIRKKVLEDLLESEYEAKTPDFINFVEYFVRGKSDEILEDIILKLYRFSESLPDKEKWFNKILKDMERNFLESDIERTLISYCRLNFEAVLNEMDELNKIVIGLAGPVQYEGAVHSDRNMVEELLKADNFVDIKKRIDNLNFEKLGRKSKDIEVDEEKQLLAKSIRDRYKKQLTEIKDDFFSENLDEIETSGKITGRVIKEFIRLAVKFGDMYNAEKKKKNVVDISDWAHLALKVLTDDDGNPTDMAKVYKEQFREIMIDEYQDSNLLQEKILTSISDKNLFMVGDVKQSIYKFRNAKPELFIEKYNNYLKDSVNRRIDLSKNFRSGIEVIDTVNAVFNKIMLKELGKIEYDEAAKLVKGGKHKEDKKYTTEVLLFDRDKENELNLDNIELEAYMVAAKIEKLKNEEFKYGDIAILLRTNEWADTFRRILISENIPATCESSTGYFSSWEVQVVLSLLRIIDNPGQDIPLCSVLLSPIGGFTEEELAVIRIDAKNESLWDALNLSKKEKSRNFLDFLNKARCDATYLSISELIRLLIDKTHFYEYVTAMPQGETRGANLDMLIVKAKDYEKSSLHGVVHFVNYMDKLEKYNVDFGEAATSAGLNTVKIMSIHKSKGLQFPVVFISGLGKSMNNQDSRSSFVIHENYGIGIDNFNIETREKKPTILRKMIARQIRLESLAEEIRLLYVAMTRAEHKLLLTGSIEKLSDKFFEWENSEQSYLSLIKVNNFLGLIMPTLLIEGKMGRCKIEIKNLEDIVNFVGENVKKEIALEKSVKEVLTPLNYGRVCDIFEKEKKFIYPYNDAVMLKAKFSVTELLNLKREDLKNSSKQNLDIKDKQQQKQYDFIEYVPEFIRNEDKPLTGAERGTLYHKVLSKIPFEGDNLGKVRELLTDAEFESLDKTEFERFFESNLYRRMSEANKRGELHREAPFVMGVKKEINEENETVLVQGIMDAWFTENENIILLDYKTDKVDKKKGEKELINRYREQLELYSEALSRATGKAVSERYIYSFSLGEEITIDNVD